MFVEVATQIRTDLIANASLIALLSGGNKSVYPLIAPETEKTDFVIYEIEAVQVTTENINTNRNVPVEQIGFGKS